MAIQDLEEFLNDSNSEKSSSEAIRQVASSSKKFPSLLFAALAYLDKDRFTRANEFIASSLDPETAADYAKNALLYDFIHESYVNSTLTIVDQNAINALISDPETIITDNMLTDPARLYGYVTGLKYYIDTYREADNNMYSKPMAERALVYVIDMIEDKHGPVSSDSPSDLYDYFRMDNVDITPMEKEVEELQALNAAAAATNTERVEASTASAEFSAKMWLEIAEKQGLNPEMVKQLIDDKVLLTTLKRVEEAGIYDGRGEVAGVHLDGILAVQGYELPFSEEVNLPLMTIIHEYYHAVSEIYLQTELIEYKGVEMNMRDYFFLKLLEYDDMKKNPQDQEEAEFVKKYDKFLDLVEFVFHGEGGVKAIISTNKVYQAYDGLINKTEPDLIKAFLEDYDSSKLITNDFYKDSQINIAEESWASVAANVWSNFAPEEVPPNSYPYSLKAQIRKLWVKQEYL